ncbi:MAG: hypothetical protein MCS20_01690, partial [Candidatus Phytoplasma mali]
ESETKKVNITTVAMTMLHTAVLHPALKFMAVLEKGPGIKIKIKIKIKINIIEFLVITIQFKENPKFNFRFISNI